MSAREELIELLTDALCARARLDELPTEDQDRLRPVIREQAISVVPGIQAWLASDLLIEALHEEMRRAGFDDERGLQVIWRTLSRIDKEASV